MLDKVFKIKIDVISFKVARSILKVQEGNQCFFVHEGGSICSLVGLAKLLEDLPNATYLYHANQEKNDFANWVRSVLGDSWLADKLERALNQAWAYKLVVARLAYLEKIVNKNK